MFAALNALADNVALLAKQLAAVLVLRQAVVASHTAGPPASVGITLGGSSTVVTGVRYLASYTPADGDTVWVLRNGGDLLVLGKLA